MDENKETPKEEEKKEEETKAVEDTNVRISPIDKANEAADRLEAANKVTTELVGRQEALAVQNKLSGTSEAGQAPEAKKEETPKEYNDRIEKEISEGKHGD